jgi:formate hydrogenlyase subunit 6/NADH:ubiquinone oxidoreductase subunit I
MSVRDVLSPFTAWKYLFRDPVTIRDPLTQRPGAPRYRGFRNRFAALIHLAPRSTAT